MAAPSYSSTLPAATTPVMAGMKKGLSRTSRRHMTDGSGLFSGKISWGSGSGQQAVTAMPPDERASAPSILWSVEPPQSSESAKRPVLSPVLQQQADAGKRSSRRDTAAGEKEPLPALPTEGAAGEPIPCGAMVVFEHAASKVTMQALGIASPISRSREVSAAEGSQASVAGFKVICQGGSSKRWMTGEKITLQHFALGTNLQADKQHKFTPYNCGRGCPIEGHIEVSISNTAKSQNAWVWGAANDVWVAEPGVLLGPDRFAYMDSAADEEGATSKYDEL